MHRVIETEPVIQLRRQENGCCTSANCHETESYHGHEASPACSTNDHTHATPCCSSGTAQKNRAKLAKNSPPPKNTRLVRYLIDKMDCPVEEQLIRNKLEPMAGIVRLDFNLLERELTVYHRLDDPQVIAGVLDKLDMAPVALEAGTHATTATPGMGWKRKALLAISGIAATGAEIIAWTTGQDTSWPVAALASVSLLAAGLPTLRKGWIALKNLTLNIYFLMSLAAAGAVIIGKWPEAAMVVFLFAIAEAVESMSLERVRQAIRALTALAPETAEVKVGNNWQEQPVDGVEAGSRIRVRTGSRVPLDARVECGYAALNQAPVTGESLPVDKETGDTLYAGSIVTNGVVEAIVTATAGNSTLARIAAAIQEAQSQRAPTQRFVDRFAHYYTPAVVVCAVAVAVLGPLLLGGAWSSWLYEALVMLVIACPCALVLSTPVTVVSGLTAAARHGILIKGGTYLENGRMLKAVAFDKTGTLTKGRPVLCDMAELGGMPIDRALLIAASLDEHSTHPVAQALVGEWRRKQPVAEILPVENFSVLNGHGVQGNIDGQLWHLGNHRLAEELGFCTPGLKARLAILENAGKSAVILCNSSGPVAVFGVADAVRPESLPAVAKLRALHVEPVMLSGDNSATVRAIAGHLEIRDARGDLMPEGKQAAITELKECYGMVGMAGDGINDAPALARADIGFAMGAAGTATALETADVAIMDDDPRKIADFICLSRKCVSILKQNMALAIGIKAVFLLLALSGSATLWMAVFADMGASLLVVSNGLRLLGHFRA